MISGKGVDAGLLQSRYRLTRQRKAILHALEDGQHHSAETILERVRANLPGVSLGTIYRTLDILRSIGLVQVFSFAGSAARYEASLDKHHHLVCTMCGSIENLMVDVSAHHALALERGYASIDCALTITGRCMRCTAHTPS